MDSYFLGRQQALIEWRDRQLFAVLSMINRAAIIARASLEEQLKDAALVQAIWDPTAFVRTRIDSLMRAVIFQELDRLVGDAAKELCLIDSQFEKLADSIVASGSALTMPSTSEPMPHSTNAQTIPDENTAPVPTPAATSRLSRLGSLVGAGAREWRAKAIDGVTDLAASMSRTIQDRSGLDERMRRVAAQHIAVAWMGGSGDPLPLKAQLIALIDDIAQKAKGMSQ